MAVLRSTDDTYGRDGAATHFVAYRWFPESCTGCTLPCCMQSPVSGMTRSHFNIRLIQAKRYLLAVSLLLGAFGRCVSAQAILRLQPGSTAVTVAGNGQDGTTTPGIATASSMGSPRGLAYDANGNLLVADARNNVIMRITADGKLGVIAGDGRQGFAGDGAAATAAELNSPEAVLSDSAGNLYIADTGNHRVRKISVTGIVTTLAGTGTAGNTGDGGPALQAQLRRPRGLALDSAGHIYIADTGNHRVRELRTDGTIAAVAGDGTEGDDGDGGPALAASLREPVGLAVQAGEGLLIADRAARRVRVVTADGRIDLYSATVRRPEGLAVGANGSVYVADAGNQVALQSTADGTSQIAGSGIQGAFTTGSPTDSALNNPAAILAASNGDVMLSDRGNHQVQKLALPRLDFGSVAAGATSAAQTVTLMNAGGQALQVLAVSLPVGFAMTDPGAECGPFPVAIQAGAKCAIAIAFSPIAQGAQTGVAQVLVSGAAPSGVLLNGIGTASGTLSTSSVTISSNGSISYAGAAVAINVSVSGGLSAIPGGNVSFYDGSALLTTIALAHGAAQWSTAGLTQGQHSLHAVYSGDAFYAGSTSANLGETIIAAPDFALSSAVSSYSGSAGGTIGVPLTLSPVSGTLNHAVNFAVSGLPSGASGSFFPSTLTLAGDPLAVNLSIQMPATLSYDSRPMWPLLAVAFLAGAVRRKRGASLLCLTLICGFCGSGCGGGFRGGSTTGGSSSKTFNYNAVVTATTTGVLGDTLTHTTTIGLVVTQ